MSTRLSAAARSAAADAVVDLVDGGTGAGYVEIRTGTQPATVDDPATGTLLVTIELAPQAFSSAVGGTATLEGVPRSGTAEGTGTAGYFRVYDGAGVSVFDGAVAGSGGEAELLLDNAVIVTGQTVTITALTYTQPAG